jgi:hypothetical protein
MTQLSNENTLHPPPPPLILHCKKRLLIFPSQAGMSLTKLSLVRNNIINPGHGESLVSDMPAGHGKISNLFYSVRFFSMLELAELNLVFNFCVYVIHSGWICCKRSTISKNHDVLIFFEKSLHTTYFLRRLKHFSALLHWNLAVKIVFKFMIWHYFYFYLTVGRIFGKNVSLSGKKIYCNHLFVLMLNRYSSNILQTRLYPSEHYPFRQYRIKGQLIVTGDFKYFLETFYYCCLYSFQHGNLLTRNLK